MENGGQVTNDNQRSKNFWTNEGVHTLQDHEPIIQDHEPITNQQEYRYKSSGSGGFGNYLKKNFLLIMIALGVWVIAYYQITSHHLGFNYKWGTWDPFVNIKLVDKE